MANEFQGVSSIIPYVFYANVSNTGSASTDLDLFLVSGYADDDGRPVMAFDGCFVGFSVQHNVAIGAGDAGLIKVTKGTTDMCSETLTKAAGTAQYSRYMPDSYYSTAGDRDIAAGDMLKVSVQSDAGTDNFGETTVTIYVQIGKSNT